MVKCLQTPRKFPNCPDFHNLALMLDPFPDNLAITWEIVSAMPKPSWQTGETEDLLCLLLVSVRAGRSPASRSARFSHTIHQLFYEQLLGLNTLRTNGICCFPQSVGFVCVDSMYRGYSGGTGAHQVEELLPSKRGCSTQTFAVPRRTWEGNEHPTSPLTSRMPTLFSSKLWHIEGEGLGKLLWCCLLAFVLPEPLCPRPGSIPLLQNLNLVGSVPRESCLC